VAPVAQGLADLCYVEEDASSDGDAHRLHVMLKFSNPGCDVIPLQTVCSIIAAGCKLDPVAVSICWSQHESLYQLLVSYGWMRTAVDGPCCCHEIGDEWKVDGHLLTVNPGWSAAWPRVDRLVNFLSKVGLSHVPCRRIDADEVSATYAAAIPELQQVWDLPADMLQEMIDVIVHEYIAARTSRASSDACEFSDELLLAAQELRQLCIVSATDKAKSHACYMCKHASMARMRAVFNDPAQFVDTPVNVDGLVSLVHSAVPSFVFPEQQVWASMHELFKAHKGNFRIITSYHDTFVSGLAVLLSDMANEFMLLARSLCHILSERLHNVFGISIRLDNIVKDSLQAAINLPSTLLHVAATTFDFVSCYDRIPLDEAEPDNVVESLRVLAALIKHNLPNGESIAFYVRKKATASGEQRFAVRCSADRLNCYRRVSLSQWIELVAALLQHAFVQFGGIVKRKATGMPQGIHFGKTVVDLYFLSYEVKFVLRRCWSAAGRDDLVQLFTCFMRFADDAAVLGGKNVESILDAVYPNFMSRDTTWSPSLEDGSDVVGSGTFLNIGLTLHKDGKLTKHAVFKEDKLPFMPNQYVMAVANRSHKFSVNIILGQVLVAMLLNDSLFSCAKHMAKLQSIFRANGFSMHELQRVMKRYTGRVDFSVVQPRFHPMDAWWVATQAF
jgi:hypothetical protein